MACPQSRGEQAGAAMVLLTLVSMVLVATAHDIRRNHEPYIYKTSASRHPQLFPFRPRMAGKLGDKMKMLVGVCSEDNPVSMKSLPARSSINDLDLSASPEQHAKKCLKNMVEVMEEEEEEDFPQASVKSSFHQMVAQANSTIEESIKMVSRNESLAKFQDTVLDFLSISGIDALLPLDCGRNPSRPDKPLSLGTYPWVAALGSHEDGRFHYRCVGVIITQYHILTDADCVTSPNINVVMVNVTDAPGLGAIMNYVAGRRVHPAIRDDEDLLSGNNIGILELARPFEFGEYVQPVCLAGQFQEPDPNEFSESTIVAYDATDLPQGRLAGLFIWQESRTLGAARCFTALKALKENNPAEQTTLDAILTERHVCVDRNFEQVGKSVVLQVDENTGRVRVLGVGGVANAKKTNPIAYTLVQPHRFWVELVIKKFRDNTNPRRSTG